MILSACPERSRRDLCVKGFSYSSAITSISTSTSRGRRATSTVERDGGVELKYFPYTAFIAAKSSMLLRNTVDRTTFPSPLPAASRISERLRSTRTVSCAPLLGSRIDCNLPRREHKSVSLDGLRVRPNSLRSILSRNDFAHR